MDARTAGGADLKRCWRVVSRRIPFRYFFLYFERFVLLFTAALVSYKAKYYMSRYEGRIILPSAFT